MKTRPTRLDYCQYLLVSQVNYTLTNFAEHTEKFSHDAVNGYLAGDQITPRLVWENVRGQVIQTPEGFIMFDDTVMTKTSRTRLNWFGHNTVAMSMGLLRALAWSLVCMSIQSWIGSGSPIIASMIPMEMVKPSWSMHMICS
jgi:hypothetical protein